MKTSIAIGFISAVLASTAPVDAAQVRFRGGLTFTEVANCNYLFVGQSFTSTFRPASTPDNQLGDNPAVTAITQIEPYASDLYEVEGPFLNNQWQRARGFGLGNERYAYRAQIRITSQVPAKIEADTEFVTLTGLLSKASNDPGVAGQRCVVKFRASYFRRHEY